MEDGTGKRVSFKSFPRSVEQLTLNSLTSSETAPVLLEDDTSANVSIFYSKLLHWEELNLSQGFTELVRGLRKFSNLPLVIWNQNEVWHLIINPDYLKVLQLSLQGKMFEDVNHRSRAHLWV